jgi:hypothetical protein
VNILTIAYNSTSQEYSPHPRGENLLRHSTPATGYITDFGTQSLDLPLTAANGITERERDIHIIKIKSAKLERLRSARLIHRDLNSIKLDM